MDQKPPIVSIILPTYNRADVLPRAIDSVLAQSFTDYELIIIDDGSEDATECVVKQYSDPRIRFLPATQNLGDAGARNRGIAQARGEWLAFQDSDDEWLPGKLQHHLDQAERIGPQYAVVAAGVVRKTPAGEQLITWPMLGDNSCGDVDFPRFLAYMKAYLQGMLLRKSAVDACGGFETRLPVISDFHLCAQLVADHKAWACREPVAVSYESDSSISARTDYQLEALRFMNQAHLPWLRQHAAAWGQYSYLLAKSELLHGNRLQALRALLRSVSQRPGFSKAWALLGIALLPTRFASHLVARLSGQSAA